MNGSGDRDCSHQLHHSKDRIVFVALTGTVVSQKYVRLIPSFVKSTHPEKTDEIWVGTGALISCMIGFL